MQWACTHAAERLGTLLAAGLHDAEDALAGEARLLLHAEVEGEVHAAGLGELDECIHGLVVGGADAVGMDGDADDSTAAAVVEDLLDAACGDVLGQRRTVNGVAHARGLGDAEELGHVEVDLLLCEHLHALDEDCALHAVASERHLLERGVLVRNHCPHEVHGGAVVDEVVLQPHHTEAFVLCKGRGHRHSALDADAVHAQVELLQHCVGGECSGDEARALDAHEVAVKHCLAEVGVGRAEELSQCRRSPSSHCVGADVELLQHCVLREAEAELLHAVLAELVLAQEEHLERGVALQSCAQCRAGAESEATLGEVEADQRVREGNEALQRQLSPLLRDAHLVLAHREHLQVAATRPQVLLHLFVGELAVLLVAAACGDAGLGVVDGLEEGNGVADADAVAVEVEFGDALVLRHSPSKPAHALAANAAEAGLGEVDLLQRPVLSEAVQHLLAQPSHSCLEEVHFLQAGVDLEKAREIRPHFAVRRGDARLRAVQHLDRATVGQLIHHLAKALRLQRVLADSQLLQALVVVECARQANGAVDVDHAAAEVELLQVSVLLQDLGDAARAHVGDGVALEVEDHKALRGEEALLEQLHALAHEVRVVQVQHTQAVRVVNQALA
mmetsp:Transcript_9389/g.38443  ORF Transcript_9389/g.38443 Transcript_9389/m.38443 type:complete len:618 (+) Transcript_9389:84-1937(+)